MAVDAKRCLEGMDVLRPGADRVEFVLNGNPVMVKAPPCTPLVRVLRDDLGMMGTKISCGIGRCGACTVEVDGRPALACMTPVFRLRGRSVVTIEGADDPETDRIVHAFVEEGALQCGYCTPGMVMAVRALLHALPSPSEEDIRAWLSGNLCRCTGYLPILRAVRRVIEETDHRDKG
ncbi:(2Fe-2S)-binding protein [Alicyclobacillus mali (ex Roth et al. 2021)]|nr:(2Fe-2S)-binding protein [Alicyclobacillus mali (ex Roth et al. 2021)]